MRPKRLRGAGIGSYVGPNEDPIGDVHGRRLEAYAVVTVEASDRATLQEHAGQVMQAVLGAGGGALRERGILLLSLAETAEHETSRGPPTIEQDLVFDVLYEHLHLPEEGGDVIATIPITIEIG